MRRRRLLASAALLPLAHAGTGAAQEADTVFVDTCYRLAGTGAFPAFFAAAARVALEREFGAAKVAALVRAVGAPIGNAQLPPDLEPIAQKLLLILYTGETSAAAGAPYFAWALAWQTLDFAAAPSLCGSAFGAWSQA